MALVKGIYSTKLKGKVGSVVYRNTVNGNVVSEKPANVSNPRTIYQQEQRAIFNAVSQTYSLMKSVEDHAFANMNGSAKNMAHFMKLNLNAVRQYVSKQGGLTSEPSSNPTGMVPRTAIAAPAIDNILYASDGTLQSLNGGAEISVSVGVVDFQWGCVTTSLEENSTFGDFLNIMHAEPGDQITLVSIDGLTRASLSSSETYVATAGVTKAYAIINPLLDKDEVITADNISNFFSETDNVTDIYTSVGTSPYSVGVAFHVKEITGSPYLYATIKSRKVDGVWQRSTEKFALTTAVIGENNVSQKWVNVLGTYDPSSNLYLNNAE